MCGNSLQCGDVSLLTTCLARELNWKLLPKTCCSMFRRSRRIDFTCAVLQAVRILNICNTFHEIQGPLNFLFKFTGINLVLVNIKPVEFNLIRLCSFCNCQMMSNFLKHPVYTVASKKVNFFRFFKITLLKLNYIYQVILYISVVQLQARGPHAARETILCGPRNNFAQFKSCRS